MYNIEDLISTFITLLKATEPDNSGKNITIDGCNVTISKEDGRLSIEINEKFDDSNIKEIVKHYKDCVEKLDDDLFVEACEEIKEVIDIKELDSLLKQESFTVEEAEKVEDMIDKSSDIISAKLLSKINELTDLYNRF